jgi:hypothetical protein
MFFTRAILSLSLPDLPLTIPIWYLRLNGLTWGIVFLVAAYGFFRGLNWAPHFIRWGGLAFLLWYWIDRLLLMQTDYALHSWPLAAGASIFIYGGLIWALSHPSLQSFF